MSVYLTRQEVADRYPISYSSLAHMARRRKGPSFLKVGKKVLYKPADIERWLDSHRVDTGVVWPKAGFVKRGRGRPRK